MITSHHQLWTFEPNHTFICLLHSCIHYPATILIFLTYAKRSWKHFLIQYVLWVGVYIGVEYFGLKLGIIAYHNGWSLEWSELVDAIMFPIFLLHFNQPIFAWIAYGVVAYFITVTFRIPIDGRF